MVSTNRPVESAAERRKAVKQKRLEKRKAARIEAHRQRSKQDQTLIQFQPDAVEIEQRAVAGGARWTLYTSIAFMFFAIAWSYWAQVDKIVSATGKLVNIEPAVILQTPLAAPVKSVQVKFGDRVESGQVLATLDPTFPQSDLKALYSRKRGLDASIERLKAERDKLPFAVASDEQDVDRLMQYRNYMERQNQYQAKIKEFESEGNKLRVQARNNTSSIAQLRKNLDAYQRMEQVFSRLHVKGSASDIDMESRKIQSREAEGKLRDALGRSEEIVAEEDALDKRQKAFMANWQSEVVAELIEHTQQRNAIEQEINKAAMMSKSVEVKVPDTENHEQFYVFEVADRSPGSVTKEGEPLFKLIPANSPLEVEIEVQGKDIGLISIGSEVRIKLTSFPYQKHGTLKGQVRTISEGSFEKEGPAGQTSTHYKVIVEIDDSVKLENVKDDMLMPGMSTIAEIKVGRRRVIQYFLYPLIRYWDTSIREP